MAVWVGRFVWDGWEGFGELFFEGFGFGVEGGAGLCVTYSSYISLCSAQNALQCVVAEERRRESREMWKEGIRYRGA